MKHLRDMTPCDLSELATLDPETPDGRATFNRLAHEMRGLPDAVVCPECLGVDWDEHEVEWDDGSTSWRDACSCARNEVGGYIVAPILDLCHPGPFDPEPVVAAVRAWTGMDLHLEIEINGHGYTFARFVNVSESDWQTSRHMAHACIYAGIIACVVYGRVG